MDYMNYAGYMNYVGHMDYMGRFSMEEINLMCIYDTSSKEALVNDLKTALPDVYEPEMIVLFEAVLEKLDTITQEEYSTIGFYAAEDEESAAFDFDGL